MSLSTEIHSAIDAVWRIESARLIAGLVRFTRDVGRAEELAQDALVIALERWPESGIPANPGAWLMATAKHKALDQFRRDKLIERKHSELAYELEAQQEPAAGVMESSAETLNDDLLRLVFISCHPILPTDARVALTLRLLGGLTTQEIARAFLLAEPTIAQRIVRAKRTLLEKRVPFEVPARAELLDRAASVLEVIYLIFNEGYAATAGEDWMRPALCESALRLGRMVTELLPQHAEAHGLVALMEIQASRAAARRGPGGEPVLLLDQDRSRWDYTLIRHGLSALGRAQALDEAPGPYTLQAAIAACHARARTADKTDWREITALYGTLARVAPSPVVELNRAVAVSMAFGPAAGLLLVDALADEPLLQSYHLLSSVRGHLLSQLGRHDEAQIEFERAASQTANDREREVLSAKARVAAEARQQTHE